MQKLQKAPGSVAGKYALLIFGLLWTGITCCVFVPLLGGMLAPLLSSNDFSPNSLIDLSIPGFLALCFSSIGVFTLIFGLRPLIAGTRVTQPDIQISTTNLKVGQEFALSYQQGFKSGIQVRQLAVQLILRESATYRRGTDTTTVTHDHVIQTFDLSDRRFEAGETYTQGFRWAIPRGAMHTFEASRNSIRWIIKIKVAMQGWPDYDEEFGLQVLPEVV